MSNDTEKTLSLDEAVTQLFNTSKALVQALVAVEQDPDLISVFSIARAHGYKPTSKFWHEQSAAVAQALNAYDLSQKAVKKNVQGEIIDLREAEKQLTVVGEGQSGASI